MTGISAATGEPINPHTTHIILDEDQAVPRALTALKYFCEEAPEYAIAVAGSFLGVALNAGVSFPVGKVTFLVLHPLSFREFLLAMGEDALERSVASSDFDMMGVFKERYEDLLRIYYFTGGMPEAVSTYVETNDFAKVRQVQRDILEAYQGDFAKHAGATIGERCRLVFDSIPRHLAKENKKFMYGVVQALLRRRRSPWRACQGGRILRYRWQRALHALQGRDGRCQQLVSDCGLDPYYWSAVKSSGEVDFIVQTGSLCVPIEVKAAENLKAKSLANFCKTYHVRCAVRTSLSAYREESWLTNVPLYAIGCLPDLSFAEKGN